MLHASTAKLKILSHCFNIISCLNIEAAQSLWGFPPQNSNITSAKIKKKQASDKPGSRNLGEGRTTPSTCNDFHSLAEM